MQILVSNVRKLLRQGNRDLAESYISTFSCEKENANGERTALNPDIEEFLKKNAIQFAEMKTAITYLVLDIDDFALLGYFTITHKPLTISADGISRRIKDKIRRFSTLDDNTNSYTVSAFLLAQFAKNYAVDNGGRISGKQLMEIAKDKLKECQDFVGGTLVYLDCEANAGLIKFYESEGFSLFGERISDKDNKRYLQYLTFV